MKKKKGMFWQREEVKETKIEPLDMYIRSKGGRGMIMSFGTYAGMDGQNVHTQMSGWMALRKAHDTI